MRSDAPKGRHPCATPGAGHPYDPTRPKDATSGADHPYDSDAPEGRVGTHGKLLGVQYRKGVIILY